MKYGVRTTLEIKIGSQSLIGIRGKYPLTWGNYFSFRSGIRCLNMWAENLKAANKKLSLNDTVEGWLFTEDQRQWFIVDDPRIPVNWLYNKFCWTGYCSPTNIDITREMFSIHGDPNNELEQFTDPKSYHEKRGAVYIERPDGGAIIKQTIKAPARQLLAGWTIEEAEPLEAIWHPDALEAITQQLSKEIQDEQSSH